MIRNVLEMPGHVLVRIMEEANAAGVRARSAEKRIADLQDQVEKQIYLRDLNVYYAKGLQTEIADLKAERARRMAQTVALADDAMKWIEALEAEVNILKIMLRLHGITLGKGENDMRDETHEATEPLH